MQGCSGISLMLGYSNPWAIWIRKQCEITPVAIQGVYDLAIAMIVDIPFAKCICVDSRGSNFQKYMTDNCYFYAPDHLKPLMLGLIENAVQDGNVEGSCLAMVNYAKASLANSMQPWFDAQFGASQVPLSTTSECSVHIHHPTIS